MKANEVRHPRLLMDPFEVLHMSGSSHFDDAEVQEWSSRPDGWVV